MWRGKVMEWLMSDEPMTFGGAKVGSTISIKLPKRYAVSEPADDWDGPAESTIVSRLPVTAIHRCVIGPLSLLPLCRW